MSKPKLYIQSMTMVDDETGQEATVTLEDLENEDRTFVCPGCGRTLSWDEGAADDMPDHCDDCWCAAHYPNDTLPLSSDITYV